MSSTTHTHLNTALENATLSVLQQCESSEMAVVRKDLPDSLNINRRGYCPGVELSVTHTNGATCTVEIKNLSDFDCGLRATLKLPVEGTGVSSVLSIREEDPSKRDFSERLTALVNHAITVLGISGRGDTIADLQMPR